MSVSHKIIKNHWLLLASLALGSIACDEKDGGGSGSGSGSPGDQTPTTNLTISHTEQSVAITGITASPWKTADDDFSPIVNLGTSHSSFMPQIVTQPSGNGVLVAWNDAAAAEGSERVILSSIDMSGATYTASHTAVDSLAELMGMTLDDAGNVYVMTGDGTSVNNGAGDGVHLDNVLDIQKFDSSFQLTQQESMNLADLDSEKVPLRSPGHAGSGRLAYGNNQLGLFFSRQTNQDSQGVIHQANMALKVNTSDLAIADDGYASGHSWDQRMIYDSRITDFVGLDLKDTFGRGVIFSTPFNTVEIPASDGSYILTNRAKVYTPKGGQWGQAVPYQWTYTRLGSIQPATNGYAVLFSTENNTTVNDEHINASLNLAFAHVKQDWSNPDYWDDDTVNLGASYNNQWVTHDTTLNPYVTSLPQDPYLISGTQWRHENKGLVWLTNYADKDLEHAQKPKMVKVADGQFLILWEKWKVSTTTSMFSTADDYVNTYAMLVNDYGVMLVGETELGPDVRLQPGDDVTVIDGKATWVTGDPDNNALVVHSIQIQ